MIFTRRGQSGKKPTSPPTNTKTNCLRAAVDAGGNNFGKDNAATTPTSDRQVTFQRPPTIPDDTLDQSDSYLTNISDAVANAATAGSLDATDISSMAKSLEHYCQTITATMSGIDQLKAEATHSSHKEDYQVYEVADMGTMRFLTMIIDKTWYRELENSETFYIEVTAFKLMDRLLKFSGGCHTIDAVYIMSDMKQYFDEAESIPVYINMM